MRVEDFKSAVFVANPKLYQEMFPPEEEMVMDDHAVQGADFEWMSGEEALAMMRAEGFE